MRRTHLFLTELVLDLFLFAVSAGGNGGPDGLQRPASPPAG